MIWRLAFEVWRLAFGPAQRPCVGLLYDPKRRRPDISKARRLLDWEPKVDLDEGLQLTIAYFRNKLQLPQA